MDFFNNSNLKKIFYILMIVSLLISLKSKVFAVDYESEDLNTTITIPDTFADSGIFYFFSIHHDSQYGTYQALLFVSQEDTATYSNGYLRSAHCDTIFEVNTSNLDYIKNYYASLNYNSAQLQYWYTQGSCSDYYLPPTTTLCGGNLKIVNSNNESIYDPPATIVYPYMGNHSDIESGDPNGLVIQPRKFYK